MVISSFLLFVILSAVILQLSEYRNPPPFVLKRGVIMSRC